MSFKIRNSVPLTI